MSSIVHLLLNRRSFTWLTSVTGLAIACHLTALDLLHRIPLCGPFESCASVLTSRYAHIGVVPLSAFGVVFYAIATWLLNLEMSGAKGAKTAGFTWSALGLCTSAALMYIAVFKVHAVCTWCVGSAVCTAIIFAFWGQIAGQEPVVFAKWIRFLMSFTTILVGFLVFLLPFSFGDESTVPFSPTALEIVSANRLIADTGHSVGDGPPTIIFFGDIGCPACHYWFPKFREQTSRTGAKLVYRHFFKHQAVWDMTLLSERIPPERFWSYLDEAIGLDGDNKQLHAAFIAKWTKVGSRISEADAKKKVDADSDLAKSLGLKLTPTLIWVTADGAKKVLAPSAAYVRLIRLRDRVRQ